MFSWYTYSNSLLIVLACDLEGVIFTIRHPEKLSAEIAQQVISEIEEQEFLSLTANNRNVENRGYDHLSSCDGCGCDCNSRNKKHVSTAFSSLFIQELTIGLKADLL
jgi:hypothetical protein